MTIGDRFPCFFFGVCAIVISTRSISNQPSYSNGEVRSDLF